VSKRRLKNLIFKIGGDQKLEEVLLDFYGRMAHDLLIGYFFDNRDFRQIARKQKDFLLFAAGITSSYSGKTPTSAHLELPPILKGHFDRRLTLLRETLRDHQLSPEDIRTWIGFENSFRNVVVDDK